MMRMPASKIASPTASASSGVTPRMMATMEQAAKWRWKRACTQICPAMGDSGEKGRFAIDFPWPCGRQGRSPPHRAGKLGAAHDEDVPLVSRSPKAMSAPISRPLVKSSHPPSAPAEQHAGADREQLGGQRIAFEPAPNPGAEGVVEAHFVNQQVRQDAVLLEQAEHFAGHHRVKANQPAACHHGPFVVGAGMADEAIGRDHAGGDRAEDLHSSRMTSGGSALDRPGTMAVRPGSAQAGSRQWHRGPAGQGTYGASTQPRLEPIMPAISIG